MHRKLTHPLGLILHRIKFYSLSPTFSYFTSICNYRLQVPTHYDNCGYFPQLNYFIIYKVFHVPTTSEVKGHLNDNFMYTHQQPRWCFSGSIGPLQ
jgi:hypothetical protein